jgi:hypothetical protein
MRATFIALCAAACAAVPTQASAIAFPSLTTIYVGAGVQDTTGAGANTATVIACANVSGVATTVRILLLDTAGAVADSLTEGLAHGAHLTAATRGVATIAGELVIDSGAITGGVVNIEATQSGVFCTAALMDAVSAEATGAALHLVRVNAHPGTVE